MAFLMSSVPTFLLTISVTAPFGRHAREKKWWHGPSVDAKLSWMAFELPNLLWSYYCYNYFNSLGINWVGSGVSLNALLLGLFTAHYVNRAIIYPLRMNEGSAKVPLIVTCSACAVTALNGYLQAVYLCNIKSLGTMTLSLDNLQHFIGLMIFLSGMYINIHSDSVLRNLRRSNTTSNGDRKQYFIPYSPFFKYVSCPNFAGEILEWFGYCIISEFSVPSIAFCVYTASNLVPRAIAHHTWYLTKFEDYPKERRWAVIPWVV